MKGRRFSPKEKAWDEAVAHWKSLATDEGAAFDRELTLQAKDVAPQVSWGTNPGMVVPVTGYVPLSAADDSEASRRSFERALTYMALKPGVPITDIAIDRVFIGSCTNSRIEDLRAAAKIVSGHHVHSHVSAMVVPGSQTVKAQAEREGLDRVFLQAGFEWREPGCSMCLGMNPDVLSAGERCASTSNRNFEGRQGAGARTHLVSPQMAAAAAVAGHFVDVREWKYAGSRIQSRSPPGAAISVSLPPPCSRFPAPTIPLTRSFPKQFLEAN